MRFSFRKIKKGRSVGRETTDSERLQIRNRRKLCESRSMYHIDDNGQIDFRYIHDSAM